MKRQTFAASVLLLVSFFTVFVWKVWANTRNSVTATIKISICGNGIVEGGEDCDGSNLDDKECSDIAGFGEGTLKCDISCSFDTSGCIKATPTPTPSITPTPTPKKEDKSNSEDNTTTSSESEKKPTPTSTPAIINVFTKHLPTLVQLFGTPETNTIPVRQLHTVMASWVTSWKQSQTQSPTTKTAAIATCDANHDNVCDIHDFSVLLYYIQ